MSRPPGSSKSAGRTGRCLDFVPVGAFTGPYPFAKPWLRMAEASTRATFLRRNAGHLALRSIKCWLDGLGVVVGDSKMRWQIDR
jgi:hypothetical protein